MGDFPLQPGLTSLIVSSPDVRELAILIFVGVVGLSAGLVIREALQNHKARKCRVGTAHLNHSTERRRLMADIDEPKAATTTRVHRKGKYYGS